MKELIPRDEYGIFADIHDTARVDSRSVAAFFEKEHFHVLRDIARITDTKSGLSKEFIDSNFVADKYKDSTGRKLPCYQMTRDGFTILVMGYTGEKAMRFNRSYTRLRLIVRALSVASMSIFIIVTANLLATTLRREKLPSECDGTGTILCLFYEKYQ